jgi:hypothetical protein
MRDWRWGLLWEWGVEMMCETHCIFAWEHVCLMYTIVLVQRWGVGFGIDAWLSCYVLALTDYFSLSCQVVASA